jgi:hypothetical protein
MKRIVCDCCREMATGNLKIRRGFGRDQTNEMVDLCQSCMVSIIQELAEEMTHLEYMIWKKQWIIGRANGEKNCLHV